MDQNKHNPRRELYNLSRYYNASQLRIDTWNSLKYSTNQLQQKLRAKAANLDELKRQINEHLDTLSPIETYWAFPGKDAIKQLQMLYEKGDFATLCFAVEALSGLLAGDLYRNRANALQHMELESLVNTAQLAQMGVDKSDSARQHYFEVLVVDSMTPAEQKNFREKLLKHRDTDDSFNYSVVFVDNFEDALIATIVNHNIQACIIRNSFPFKSRNKLEILKLYMLDIEDLALSHSAGPRVGIELGYVINDLRPELNLYLITDIAAEDIASKVYKVFRRVFYRQDNYLELHLSLRQGILERYETPFFSALKDYSQRPTGVFHALPLSRGNSLFKSHWIQDMVGFYGHNIFLAETSSTSRGLDSLLHPTGSLKKAQEMAAKTFGAQQTYFVTNGTSAANKIVLQGLLKPGDIVLVDRDCHKSVHYAMVLAGAHPVYLNAYPLSDYSMYGAVPLREIKRAMLQLKQAGELERLKLLLLTNCTFDGIVYDVERVMEEVLAIKPDIIFFWDEAWFGAAGFSHVHRQRTAMRNAARLKERYESEKYRERFHQFQQRFAKLDPNEEKTWLDTQLLPDPQSVRVRAYATQSTHKKLTSLRQGAMIHVFDQDFNRETAGMFWEAYMTHTSTSPNYQILASLDIARRQMEFEGFEFVQKSIEHAMTLRAKITDHPLLSKFFEVLTIKDLIPAKYRSSQVEVYYDPELGWGRMETAWRHDEFVLDPTHITLFIGKAGIDGNTFKNNYLMDQFGIQVNKTSRNTVLLMTNIGTTRSSVAYLLSVLLRIARNLERRDQEMNEEERALHLQKVKSLTEELPPLPHFSCFHSAFRTGKQTIQGDIRSAFYLAYEDANCEYLKLDGSIQAELQSGRSLVSASFITPYPPGFPILVPGQVINQEILDFMLALDVKEIHGYRPDLGLHVFREDALAARERELEDSQSGTPNAAKRPEYAEELQNARKKKQNSEAPARPPTKRRSKGGNREEIA